MVLGEFMANRRGYASPFLVSANARDVSTEQLLRWVIQELQGPFIWRGTSARGRRMAAGIHPAGTRRADG